jgi:hypothetical protein
MLENLEPQVKPLSCKVRTISESLKTEDRKILLDAIHDPKWTPYTLSGALAKRGITLGDKTIRKHQINQCSCGQLGS